MLTSSIPRCQFIITRQFVLATWIRFEPVSHASLIPWTNAHNSASSVEHITRFSEYPWTHLPSSFLRNSTSSCPHCFPLHGAISIEFHPPFRGSFPPHQTNHTTILIHTENPRLSCWRISLTSSGGLCLLFNTPCWNFIAFLAIASATTFPSL